MKKQTEDDIEREYPESMENESRPDALQRCEAERNEYLEGWKRMKADYANIVRQMNEDRLRITMYAEESILRELLDVADSMDEGMKHDTSQGFVQIRKKINVLLKKYEVTEIPTESGQEFDPRIHEALFGEGHVIKNVHRKGYYYRDKVLRPSQVTVQNTITT